MPPKKHLRKKTKSDWRKNVDISKEEETLAANIRDQIHGGAPEEKADTDLFFEDRAQTKLTKKNAARAKVLSAELRLQSKSSVPARAAQTSRIDYTGRQVQQLAKKVGAGVQLGTPKTKTPGFIKSTAHDLWAEELMPQEEENDWIPKPELPKRPASMDEKPSHLRAVPAPEAAASYRPTNSDIRKLKKEVKEEQARKKAAKEKLEAQFAYPASLKSMPKAMKVDTLDPVDEQSEDVKEEDEESDDAGNHYSTKLTEKERRRMKRKDLKERKKAKAAHRAKLGDFNERVDTMLEQIAKREQELKERADQRQQRLEAKKFAPLKLNTGKVQVESKAALLHKPAKRLVESLKSTDGMRDRFRSLQMRNILEPKKKIKKPKSVAERRWAVSQSYKED